jgi:hypothetical protein
MLIELLDTIPGVTQDWLLLNTQLIISLFEIVLSLKVLLLVPVFNPFFIHWYEGVVIPGAAVAVKVTLVPGQIVFPGLAVILMDAAIGGFTVMVIVFDVACVVVRQFALDVIMHEIASPLAGEESTSDAVPFPTLVIPFFH